MSVRIDKWLWATRFFKTRALAKKHVESGKVKVNGQKTKPSRLLNLNDVLEINKEDLNWVVEVLQLIEKRVSAKLAAEAYEETPESIQARNDAVLEKKLVYSSTPKPPKHPDKKSRRQLIRIKHNQSQ
ncbi:MAG: S4 domain-containing protein [Gammaproteobacteria bacterium]|jgi:ribosome-associated heat shock protein Hsp15